MSEIAKKEKARRVWRLNKKEGIPVLEALETVDISKDVYYRIKDEYEEKWENEILTVEQIQKRLREVTETLEKREKKLEQVEERMYEARRMAGEIEGAVVAEQQVSEHDRELEELRERVETLEAEGGLGQGPSLKQVMRKVRKLERQNLDGRVSTLEGDIEDVRGRVDRNSNRYGQLSSEIPESVWDLL